MGMAVATVVVVVVVVVLLLLVIARPLQSGCSQCQCSCCCHCCCCCCCFRLETLVVTVVVVAAVLSLSVAGLRTQELRRRLRRGPTPLRGGGGGQDLQKALRRCCAVAPLPSAWPLAASLPGVGPLGVVVLLLSLLARCLAAADTSTAWQ